MDDSCDGAINLEEFSKLVPGWFFLRWWFHFFFLVEVQGKIKANPGNSANVCDPFWGC